MRAHSSPDIVVVLLPGADARVLGVSTRTRNARAGSIVGSGTVSNRDEGQGASCIAELRAVETVVGGAPATPYLAFGDRIRIEAIDGEGDSVFGAIDQTVARAGP